MEENKREHLWVCERCLCGIESHEGKQITLAHYIDNDAPEEEHRCDWCQETFFDELYELI